MPRNIAPFSFVLWLKCMGKNNTSQILVSIILITIAIPVKITDSKGTKTALATHLAFLVLMMKLVIVIKLR